MGKKRTRRVRGPDNKLYTKEELEKLKLSADATGSDEKSTTEVKTKGGAAREDKKSVQEKVKKDEKDNSPVLIVSYNDPNGKRITKQYTCDRIEMTENRGRTLQKSGTKTNLDLYIEATVIEEM